MSEGAQNTPLRSILVVDDDPLILAWLDALLFYVEGVEVCLVEDGRAGVEHVITGAYDVLLTDLSMPGTSGVDVLEAARREAPDCVCLAITAYSDVERAVRAMQAGAYDVLLKPLDPELTMLGVRRALERQELAEREDLQAASRILLGAGDAETLAEKVVSVAQDVLSADAVVLARPDGQAWRMWTRAGDHEQDELALVDASPAALGSASVRRSDGDLHTLGLRLISSDHVHGVLWALRTGPDRAFSARDERRAGLLAGNLCLALDNGRLVLELRDRIHTLNAARAHLLDASRWDWLGRAAGQVAGRLDTSIAYVRSHVRAALEQSDRQAADGISEHLRFCLDGLERADTLQRSLRAQEGLEVGLHPIRELIGHARQLGRNDDRKIRVTCDPSLRMDGHGGEVVIALVELIDNAHRAMAEHPNGVVEVRAERFGDAVSVAVTDRGPGFDVAAVRPYRSSWGRPGLGLKLAREALARAGGSLEVRSSGEGVTARVVVPGVQPASEDEVGSAIPG